MKPSKLSVALSLSVVFLSGIVVGGLAHRFFALREVAAAKARPSSEEWRRQYVEEMRSRLEMNDNQVQRLNRILDNTRSRYREVRKRISPELKSIQQEQVDQIRATLSDTQRTEYEKLREEREKRRSGRRNHPH